MENVYLVMGREDDYESEQFIIDVCATEKIANAAKKKWEEDNPNDKAWVEPWEVETRMPEKLKDIDCVSFLEHFKLNHSGADYIVVEGPNDCKLIVNLSDGCAYTIDEIRSGEFGAEFYTKDNDKTFLGVKVVFEDE